MPVPIDPRPQFRAAQEWVGGLIDQVTPAQLDRPTPCADWTVRDLLGHIVAVATRVAVVGQGGHPFSVPAQLTGLPDEAWSERYQTAVAEVWKAWDNDALIDATVTVPPGVEVPGFAAISLYLTEALVHGWDLAVATGQDPEAPPAIVEPALASARQSIPATPRGGSIPFDPPVPVADDAPPTRQLAAWLGRR
jgi:uncharacterized protein (TIGR03086 family)